MLRLLLTVLSLLLLSACANMVTPTGGPKDTTPPKVTQATPENQSTGFIGRKVEVTFDEYVTLNNASQQVLVSPPLASKPDIKLNNKTVVIKFKDNLLPNTTYTIDFGEAVKDLHEGNLFKDYTYAFSTGDRLDTLLLAGTVVDAETQKPVEKCYVGLYAADSLDLNLDSLFVQPLRRAPDFLTRTDKEGKFRFHGLPDRSFLVFALDDVNANLYYDMPNEKVAFLDTLVRPSDSLSLTLSAFIETDTTQMLLESKLVEEGLLRFTFRQPADSVSITLENPAVDSFQMVQVWSAHHDTLCCYFTPRVVDSLLVDIQYDTLINIHTPYSLAYRESRVQNRPNANLLKIGNNLKNKLLMPGEELLLSFTEPIVQLREQDSILLVGGVDTLFINTTHFVPADSCGQKYRFTAPLNDTTKYALSLPDSLFHSVRGRTHRALSLNFSRAGESDFGNIIVRVQPPEHCQVVVQLLDGRGAVVESRLADTLSALEFRRLLPDKYKLKAILDADRNGKWSTGNFHRRFLPETVVDFKDELDLKAGWDIDLDEVWRVEK